MYMQWVFRSVDRGKCRLIGACCLRVCRIALAYTLGVLVFLPACGRTTDPKPGDKDYPVENSHPAHIIQFSATVPQSLSVSFRVTYLADPAAGGSPDNANTCVRTAGLAVAAPFGVYLPLRLTQDGNTYRGAIEVDHFLPGTCNWHIAFVEYHEAHSSLPLDRIAQFGDQYPFQLDYQLHLWCIKDLHSTDANHPELCGTPMEFANYIRSDYIERIPADERKSYRADARPSTKSITVSFHDLNSLTDAQEFIKR
jgi:hypothetical protein